jgi:uncharacterized protein
MRKQLATHIVFFLLFSSAVLFALDVPELRGRVNDYADMIAPEVEARIDAQLRDLEVSDSTQVAVLTINSLEGEALGEYSIRVVEDWALGQKGIDNGILLLVSKNDRKIRIEVGYGLEGVLTDLLTGRIIDHVITPRFKSGNFNEGFEAGVEAIVQSVRGEYVGTGEPPPAPRRRSVGVFPFVILFIVISLLGSRKRYIGGIAGAILLPLILWFVLPLGWIFLLAMIPLGFGGGLLIPGLYLFSGFGRRGYRSGGGFGSGGFSGGGFSGGGGGFGGGGASGGW